MDDPNLLLIAFVFIGTVVAVMWIALRHEHEPPPPAPLSLLAKGTVLMVSVVQQEQRDPALWCPVANDHGWGAWLRDDKELTYVDTSGRMRALRLTVRGNTVMAEEIK